MNISAQDVINAIFHPDDTVCLRIFDDRKEGIFTGAKMSVEAGKFFAVESTLKEHNQKNHGIFFVVNSGGQTDMFVLPAPAPSESFRPGEGIPYELYSIDTSAPGFYGVKNLGVAVYPEITTIQRVELIPVSAIGGGEVIIYEPNAEL